MKTKRLPFISIIVPAYKAEPFIVSSLKNIVKEGRKIASRTEFICVVDGKNIDRTYDLAKRYAKGKKDIRVVGYKENKGKGYAVRYGMRRANGSIVGFIDAGLEIDPVSLKKLVEELKSKNADIVVGSKRHRDSNVHYPALRQVISNLYYFLVKVLFNPRLSDTQAGIKIFKKRVLKKVLPILQINGFAFDIEMLMQAEALGFKKVYEAPINVNMVKTDRSTTLDSMSKLLGASVRMFYDTLLLFLRLER